MSVNIYSVARDGDMKLSENFRVLEFACKDGSDKVLISDELVSILQKIRDYFETPVTINSAYRNASHNAAVGGVPSSQHLFGTAADIHVGGVEPLKVAQYAEKLIPHSGGIGLYVDFVHVDVRLTRARWDSTSGIEKGVSGFWAPIEENDEQEEIEVRYKKLSDIPESNGFRAIIDQLMTAGIINGDGSDPEGNDDVIDLSHDMVRMLIFNYRAGVYDDALRAAGLDPEEYK